MLSYNDSRTMEHSYDRYDDPDPDNTCDQLVDFSKRYPENDPEEICFSPEKNSPLPQITMNSEVPRVYNVEDTPLTISSASSVGDLRIIGNSKPSSAALISEEQSRKEYCFSQPSDLVYEEVGKTESNNEETCTKASTPIMFSRSSSIGSLNSFEQHSIVDDRSSVSAFSNLASGLISPSELPDSPGGLESPFISKSNNTEFVFPTNDASAELVFPSNDEPTKFAFPNNNESVDSVLLDQTVRHEDFPVEGFGDAIKVFNDEGDCSSISGLSALSIPGDSPLNHFSISDAVSQSKNRLVSYLIQNLPVTINCPIPEENTDFIEKCQNLTISDQSFIPEPNCIGEKSILHSNVSYANPSEKSVNIIETKYEDKGTSTSEDFNFCDNSYKWTSFSFKDMQKLLSGSMGEMQYQQNEDKQSKDNQVHLQRLVKEFKELLAIEGSNVKNYLQNESSNYSKGISDKCEGIPEECILSGNPSKDTSLFNESQQFLNHSFQTSGSLLKEDLPNSSFSDNDISDDEDDGILNECVLLGMPQKPNCVQIKTEKNSIHEAATSNSVMNSKSSVSESSNHQIKLFTDGYHPSTMLVDIKEDLTKSDDDSDIDESDLLVQQCIQLGRSELRNPKALSETNICVIPPSNKALGSRDNWPDGVSDGEDDDDDDILNEIIKAGKPNSNSQTIKLAYAAAKPCLKSQNQRKLTAAEDRALFLETDFYGNFITKQIDQASPNSSFDIDDTCVYRTEDTPISSPSASTSDLSTLSCAEDKVCQESFLNNSRNSDCSSDSEEDDEMLLQCIRQGMPGGKRVVV